MFKNACILHNVWLYIKAYVLTCNMDMQNLYGLLFPLILGQ